MINKNLLLLCGALFVSTSMFAKNTICYKKSWEEPSTIEVTPLDGGECKSEKSLKTMLNEGWYIKDIEIKSATKGLDYNYILSDINPVELTKELTSSNDINAPVDTSLKVLKLSNVSVDSATINIGNLKIGQSGVIEHLYEDGHSIIVSSAYVKSSNASTSEIKFLPFLDLKQNAIPTTNRKAQNGDRFILNYMYDQSLLIAPNIETFKYVRENFETHNFIHSDIFGAYLKSEYQPNPSQKLIQDYAMSQNLGTIFFVVKSDLYIVDSRTFTILGKKRITNVTKKSQMPFYTRIENIESNLFTNGWFGWLDFSFIKDFLEDNRTEEEILYGDLAKNKSEGSDIDYNTYYSNILGLKK